jgi:hypothetical protein
MAAEAADGRLARSSRWLPMPRMAVCPVAGQLKMADEAASLSIPVGSTPMAPAQTGIRAQKPMSVRSEISPRCHCMSITSLWR